MQPWASLVACGAKKIETRSWSTSYRGDLAIHASQTWNDILQSFLSDWEFQTGLAPLVGKPLDLSQPTTWSGVKKDHLPFGAIIAVCKLVDCIPVDSLTQDQIGTDRFFGDFTPGRFAWILENVKPLEKPISAKGRLGLWDFYFDPKCYPELEGGFNG